jgi:hypothetical protein
VRDDLGLARRFAQRRQEITGQAHVALRIRGGSAFSESGSARKIQEPAQSVT